MNASIARYAVPLVQAVIGLEWLRSGYEKLAAGNFVAGMPKTLAFFASKNPTGWYRDFLTTQAIPNAHAFGYAVMWGETLAGIALLVTAGLYLMGASGALERLAQPVASVALLGGAWMSWNFWLAAGWTSPSTDSVNYVMGLIQVVLLAATLAALAMQTRARQTRTYARPAMGAA